MPMHAEEVAIDESLLRRLLAEQFPQFAQHPIQRVAVTSTEHVVFRIGDRYCARLPRVPWAAQTMARELVWLPRIEASLPFPIPVPVGAGRPTQDYPWPWALTKWLPGLQPGTGDLAHPESLAADLAEFVAALRTFDVTDAPANVWQRPLSIHDQRVQTILASHTDGIDTEAIGHVWQLAMRAPEEAQTWVHGDLSPSNVLCVDGRLSAVVDFSVAGVGDPALDLRPAWNLFPPTGRGIFRDRLSVDDAQWLRGCGWTLLQALSQLSYFQGRHPALEANAVLVLDRIAHDFRS